MSLEFLDPILRPGPVVLILVMVAILGRIIAKVFLPPFQPRPLLNKSEQRLFPLIVSALPQHTRVMCQVSYGEFLSRNNRQKFFGINAKRADFVVCDARFRVLAVVEYQGGGHYGNTFRAKFDAKGRDRQKRRALKEAGIPMIEIPAKFDVGLIRALFRGF